MLLKKITLVNFRNFDKEVFSFNPFLTLIIGENARGKTNLLESIYFSANGVGFRESKEEELINMLKSQAMVDAVFTSGDDNFDFKISLGKNELGIQKKYFINKTLKKHFQYLKEQTKAILFSPEQILIVTGPPDLRRDYFNRLIGSHDMEYKKRLGNYENAVRRRNKVLEFQKNEAELKEELLFWNEYLEQQSSYLTSKRQEYVDYLNKHPELEEKTFRVEYVANILNKERFAKFFEDEKRWRRTLIGPHRDEFKIFLLNNHEKNIQHFGSRSEQRLSVMWLKINEVKYYEEKLNHKPILLLDDIFSELDSHNKKLVLNLIKKYQTVATTTEKEIIPLIDVPQTIIQL